MIADRFGGPCVGQPAHRFVDILQCAHHVGRQVDLVDDLRRRQMRVAERQRDREHGALPDDAVRADLAAMEPHQLLHEREADAAALEAAALRALHAVEALEKPGQLVLGDADAGIANLDGRGLPVGGGADRNTDLAREGKLEGIGEQVQQNLLQHLAIDIDGLRKGRAIQHQPEPGLLDRRTEARRDAGGETGEVGRPVGRLDAAGLDAREVEQRIDQPQQPVAIAMRQRHVAPCILGRHFGIQHFLERTQHEGERRAELVADVGEEGGLGAVQLGQRLDPATLFLVGVGAGDRRADLAGDEVDELGVAVVEQPVGAEADHEVARASRLARGWHGSDGRPLCRPVPDPARHGRAKCLREIDEAWRLVL